ncbi:MAG: cytochrome c peroxidase [Actinomycetota bacterium]
MHRIKLFIVFVFALVFAASKFSLSPVVVSGQTSLLAPTDVTATDGIYSTKVGLRWDTMRGATIYRIFRNTTDNPEGATDLGTTQANTFFDANAPQGQTFFYWVRSENANTTSGFSQSEQGARANGVLGGGIQPLQPPSAPPGNPITAAKASLGKALFWDEQLSSTRTVACGTCHSGSGGGIDKRTAAQRTRSTNPGIDGILNTADDVFGSPGVTANNLDGTYNWSNTYGFREQVTGRRSIPYTDSAYPNLLFWDGRASNVFRDPLTNQIILQNGGALESQVLGPPVSDTEMAHSGRNWQEVANRITNAKPLVLATNVPTGLQNWIDGRTYPQLFEEAFGTPEVTPVRIALAIATHERTLFSDQTPFDQVNQGVGTLTAAEQRGTNLFGSGVTGCSACHAGNLQTDNAFHYIGLRPANEDTGRQLVTNNQADAAQFRTPTLRNVELRGAYFHNGNFTTLRQVVDFYNRGGDFNAPNKDPNVRPRGLNNGQLNDLVAFLSRPLTDPRVRAELPPFDRPSLYTESNRVPVLTGTGVAGAGSFVPTPMAIEPPLVGNPSFTVAVSNALGNSEAVLVVNSTDPGTASIPASGSFTRQTINLGGTGAGNGNGSIALAIPDNQALVGQTFFGRWYVTDAATPNGFAVSPAFRFTIFGTATAINRAAQVDFDGDRKTDISIFRPSNGQWWYSKSSDGQTAALQFGTGTDKIVPVDFSGDGKTDVAVWHPVTGEWFILRSEDNSFYSIPFGTAGDIPAPADFDGDGKADLAVFRPSTGIWFIQGSSQGTLIQQFGTTGDIPQVGDYDGDGKADLAIFRPANGQWWINRSSSGVIATTFGVSTDKPVAADYTGDGKTDIAFYRPASGEWFVLRSEDASYFSVPFGISTDIPAPGDYDGDGKADFAVFRPSTATWYVNRSTQGLLIATFGSTGDTPAPAAFVP